MNIPAGYIEYLKLGTFENAKSRGWNGTGYYFWDEADGQYCYGPYKTYNEALIAFEKYAEHLTHRDEREENLMNNKIKTAQDNIDHIMDHFDFAKVVKTMEALNWEWSSTDGVPDESEARTFARGLLKSAAARIVSKEENHCYIGCGGFVARKYYDGGLELEFVVTSWSSPLE
jgi:hypothetical protein